MPQEKISQERISKDPKAQKKAMGGIMRRRVTMKLARVRFFERASLGFEQPQQEQQWQTHFSSQTRPKVKGVISGMMWMCGKDRNTFQNRPGRG